MTCEPDSGEWLGFRIGMTRPKAVEAGCRALLDNKIKASDTGFSIRGGRCVAYDQLWRGSERRGIWDSWRLEPKLHLTDRHCYGPEAEILRLMFSAQTGQLKSIRAVCGVTLP